VILVPGRDLANQLAEGLPNLLVQLGGNLLLFAAFGALAPLRYRIGFGTVVAIAALGSTGIELAQYLLDIGRFSSVDDVVVNTAGAGLAALATRRWWRGRAGLAALATRRWWRGRAGLAALATRRWWRRRW
jgi:glycopeptide antibiotics resistance protein